MRRGGSTSSAPGSIRLASIVVPLCGADVKAGVSLVLGAEGERVSDMLILPIWNKGTNAYGTHVIRRGATVRDRILSVGPRD